ncbi:hypothetical protein [Streptomyces flaveolus]|uniref:hypothetical protein n=1 Tax=Streptomyces flaveolus TaxID=67297 RepID=UPI003D9F257A
MTQAAPAPGGYDESEMHQVLEQACEAVGLDSSDASLLRGQRYAAFADAYGWDVTRWPGYDTLAAIRELRMITTNARKVHHAPSSLEEVQRRVDGLRRHDRSLRWNIL